MARTASILPAACAALALAGCHRPPAPRPLGDTNPQTELARSLAIIATSTRERPKTLKILFYGQSITSTKWTDAAASHLRATYPDTGFAIRNLAIGGFESRKLERTVERDVGDFYPDLIVFHVYGDHRAYERILRTIRSRTAAEIILQTDHVTMPVEPLCDTGLHLTLPAPPGCRGFLWYRQKSWEEHVSGALIPGFARTYGLAVDPRRWAWNAYLDRHRLPLEALLADPPHPNDRGWALMARLFDSWFDLLVRRWTPHPQALAIDLPLPADGAPLTVTGNRIELIAAAPLARQVAATVDGKPPAAIDGCWQTSRATMLATVPYWPAIKQIDMTGSRRAERWSAILSGFSPDQKRFRFRLYGSRTGFDGEGDGAADFVSRSGRVRIKAADWMTGDAAQIFHQTLPEGYRVGWDRHFACGDEPAIALPGGRAEIRHVVATGLADGVHRLVLRVPAALRGRIASIRVYRPPLAD